MSKKIDSSFPYSQTISFRLNSLVPTKQNFVTEIYYNPKLERKIASIEPKSHVNLSYWNLLDHDMPIIFKHIIINKQCTKLSLCGNKITSEGVAILAFRLPNNSTLRSLDLSYNHIADAGVYSLSEVLLPNHCVFLKKLVLNKNGITNDGMKYLSEMLSTNQTLTELSLSNNEIGDEGVKQLANVLIDHNRTLKVLVLSFNLFITDLSIDYLLQMFEHNHTLRKLVINNCTLSEPGKMKLREKVAKKKKFAIEV
jgi:Ran GTPase-activating protein (RanGAP) involved in mRNA processing and transport